MRLPLIPTAIISVLLSSAPVLALESYSTDLSNQFTSWCTATQGQPQTVCSCAVNKAALEIPASALASFLNAPEGSAMAITASGVGATALQIVTTCTLADGAGTTGVNTLQSLGGSTFGQ